jgi:hypothetical protein
MDLKENEAGNDCPGGNHQHFNRPTEKVNIEGVASHLPFSEDVNTEAEESTLLRTVTQQRLVKTN